MDLGVRDHAYVVFGGTRGIGFAAARALVADGASIALVGRNEERAAAAAQSLGDRATSLAGDLCVEGEAERVLDAARGRFGTIRGVAVTTGLGIRGQRALLDASDVDWTE